MNLIIAGGRDFNDYTYLKTAVKNSLIHWGVKPQLVISGGASGADSLAIEWAKEANIAWKIYRPNYDRYPPKFAPIMRNKEMAEAGTHLIAFWDGVSRGTQNMIQEMGDKPTFVFGYKNET